jgi:imidazolonepropionase-like amidohydrolase
VQDEGLIGDCSDSRPVVRGFRLHQDRPFQRPVRRYLSSVGDDPQRQVVSYSLEETLAVVDESHRNGLKVSAHCIGEGAVTMALDAGIDVIEHGYAITSETRKRLADSGVPVGDHDYTASPS